MGSLKAVANERRWVLLGALGLLALLLVVAALVLPRWVDADSYRDILRSSLERQLERSRCRRRHTHVVSIGGPSRFSTGVSVDGTLSVAISSSRSSISSISLVVFTNNTLPIPS